MTDVVINPQTLVYNGAPVSDANPLPCSQPGNLSTPNIDVPMGPVTWVVNGAIVSDSNPLPITLV